MFTVGVDPHKHLLWAEALDEQGRSIESWHHANDAASPAAFLSWMASLGDDVQVAIEGAHGYGRSLAHTLVAAGVAVFDINPRWTAAYRRTARRSAKSDRDDARAVAQVLLRDGPADLPQVFADDTSAVLDLLTHQRESLIAEMTRTRNQLHVYLFELGCKAGPLTSPRVLGAVLETLPGGSSPRALALLDAVRRTVHRLLAAHEELALLTREAEDLARAHYAPLTEIHGVGLLTAAVIASELGSLSRFTTDAQLAAFAGVAPIEASSAGATRHRLNRGGNRRLNAVLYRIVLTQRRADPRARAYIARRRAEGRTLREAIRCLKRYIARAIFHAWLACSPLPATTPHASPHLPVQLR